MDRMSEPATVPEPNDPPASASAATPADGAPANNESGVAQAARASAAGSNERFIDLSGGNRVWVVGAVHGDSEALAALHDEIGGRFEPGDRVVYSGNLMGFGTVRATIDEVLRFRRSVLAFPPLHLPDDIVFLRGQQEEMWHKLLQIHFAPKPSELMRWMFDRGVDATLRAYGGDPDQGFAAAREGMVALTRWTGRLKAGMQAAPGHHAWFTSLRRYATTGPEGVLMVHAGLDPSRGLEEQRDAFWWETAGFAGAAEGYQDFSRVVCGFDPKAPEWTEDGRALSIDTGCGRGGALSAVCLSMKGDIMDRIFVSINDDT